MDYSEFREQYEAQHPASVPQAADFRAARVYPWWLQVVVLIMFICAALMSGVHTVPTVREGMPDDQMFSDAVKDLIAYGSFAAFELSVFSASYALLRRGSRWVWLTLAVSFLVMVASNLLQVTRAFAVRGDPGTQMVAVIVGIGAPLVALLSGKILVDIHRTNAGQDADCARRFQEARQRHDADVLAAYEKLQKRAVRSASAGRPQRTEVDASDERDHATGQGYSKRADARAVVWRHLEAYPEDADANVRGLADRLHVGKSTVSDVQRAFRERTLKAINGHGQAEWMDDERTE